jgi:hypothetical protein
VGGPFIPVRLSKESIAFERQIQRISLARTHLYRLSRVRVGQSVKCGQIIGRLGTSGRSTGPHLHYETRIRGEAVDPQKFLRAAQKLDGSI